MKPRLFRLHRLSAAGLLLGAWCAAVAQTPEAAATAGDVLGRSARFVIYLPRANESLRQIAAHSDLMIVVGSSNSSNSVRLVEVALDAGAQAAYRVDDAPKGEDLVQDPFCKTYVPKSQAYVKEIYGKPHYFCGKECFEKYLTEKK